MYISKITMSLSEPAARKALYDCQKMHQLVTGLFGTSRSENDILFRTRTERGNIAIYIYSSIPVKNEKVLPWMNLVACRNVDGWLKSLQAGGVYGFDILATPTKKVPRENGRSQRRVLRTEEERLNWLKRKAEQNGFEIVSYVLQNAVPAVYGSHEEGSGGDFAMGVYQMQGYLKITNEDLFRKAVQKGIGAGKAYGIGMLMLKSA